jgi:hypothetical protein
MEECMPSLYYKVILPYVDADSSHQYIPLDRLLSMDTSSFTVFDHKIGSQAQSLYANWLRIKETITHYDYFLSYRWGGDSQLVRATHDRLSLLPYPSPRDRREVAVFLDQRRLKDGENFQSAFAKSMLSSTVVIPFVSFEALERMILRWGYPEEDNVLIEWILALEGLRSPASNISKIFPVITGRRVTLSGSISNIFADPYKVNSVDQRNILQSLPDSTSDPLMVSSVARARQLLTDNGIEPSSALDQMTVKTAVSTVMKHIGVMLHEYAPPTEELIVRDICKKANDILKDHVTTKEVSEETSISTEVNK